MKDKIYIFFEMTKTLERKLKYNKLNINEEQHNCSSIFVFPKSLTVPNLRERK